MRFFLSLFALISIIVFVNGGRVRDFISSILNDQPDEVRSAILSDFSDLTTITVTDSSVLSSVSSQINSAIDSVLSTFSTATSDTTATSLPTLTTTIRRNDATSSNYSVFAAIAALLMSVVFFQAL